MKKLLIAMVFTVSLMAQHIQPGQHSGFTPGRQVIASSTGALTTGPTVYADQFAGATITNKLDAAITALGTTGLVIAPSTMGLGSPTSIPNGVMFWDLRGTELFGQSFVSRPVQSIFRSQFDEIGTRTLTGTLTFTNGSTVVTGSGTAFTTEVGNSAFDPRIFLTADGLSAGMLIASITDNTHLTLAAPYTGTGGSGAASATITNQPLAIINTLSGGTATSSQYGEVVGLSIFSTRTGGSRGQFGLNINSTYNNRSRMSILSELDLTNASGTDWPEGGLTIDGEVNHSVGILLQSANAVVHRRNEIGIWCSANGLTDSNWQRCLSLDGWQSKGIYSKATNTSGIHLYMVPAADNGNEAMSFRNAADSGTVHGINNDGTEQISHDQSVSGEFAFVMRSPSTGGFLGFSGGKSQSGSYNSLVQAGDQTLIFSNVNSGATSGAGLVLAPWAASSGLRMNYLGFVGIGNTGDAVSPLRITGVPVFANNAAAVAGGLAAGALYRTGADPDPLMIVH